MHSPAWPWIWALICGLIIGVGFYLARQSSDVLLWTSVVLGAAVFLIKAPAP